MNTEINKWLDRPKPFHGPVFLAWTAVCYQIGVISGKKSTADSIFDYSKVLSAALSCGAFSLLKNMLQESPLRNDEVINLPYFDNKYIIITFFFIFLA